MYGRYFSGYSGGITDGTADGTFGGAAISSFIKNVTDSSGGSSGGTSIVVGNAYRLVNYEAAGSSGDASLFYRIGMPSSSVKTGTAWTYFPSTAVPAATSILGTSAWSNTNLMVVHLGSGTFTHDLAFIASSSTDNVGIVYSAAGRGVSLILDTNNYKTKGCAFTTLTATNATCTTVKAAYSSA